LQRYIEYAYGQKVTSDAIEHCKANLDSGRIPVERHILSFPVNDKLLVRLVTSKQISYGFEATSPTRSKGKFQSRCFKIILDFKEDFMTKRIIFDFMWIKSECVTYSR